MSRVVKFIVGAAVAALGGLFLISSTYALSQALQDKAYDQMLYPAGYAAVALVVLVIGLRFSLRAIVPAFTFTRLILVAVIVAVLLHLGGYASLSSEKLKQQADNIQNWMRQVAESVPE
ncbi:MAG: hypothetical protein HQ592_16635 [Planctomycetes bacterium]|nr:hypothetical protein [Planctomycetota bacterium]